MLHQIKAPHFDTYLGHETLLNPLVNDKIQGLFKAFECFSGTFLQGKFNFQGLFKTVLYIQVLFKPVRTLILQWLKKILYFFLRRPILS